MVSATILVWCGFVYLSAAQKPTFSDYNPEHDRSELAHWLLFEDGLYLETSAEFPPYDGWYNNLAVPDSGAIDRPLLRRWPAAYDDGTYLPAGKDRPNPLELSEQLLQGPIGSKSRTGKNALLVYFGQQIVEEIIDSQRPACPPEYFNIKIPPNHSYRKKTGHTEMPVLRTRFDQRTGMNPNNPRQQLNEITPYIDGGLIYGTTKQWADQLRTYSNGTIDPDGLLAYSENGLFPERNTHRLPMANPPPPLYHSKFIKDHETLKVDRFFKLGNPRGNENTFLLTFGILWFRWHNYLAKNIRAHNANWTSEQVFNEARKWVIATQQHIIMDEWLPSWINRTHIPEYRGYDPSINPQIDQFFQSAAFRFGHTLVTPGVYLRDYGRNMCRYKFEDIIGTMAVRTCNAFWRPQDAILSIYDNATNEYVDIDRVLMGMAYQICEREDHMIVEDLRGNVFGPLEFPRRDLMAINIQRGRDHGLPDFNSAREAFGLDRITDFNHFNLVDPIIVDTLRTLYKDDINNIDVWVGGILETGDGPGQLFETIIIDQFRRIRDGDRFWYENRINKLFSAPEIGRIKQLNLYDIIMAVTKMDPLDIQTRVTRVPGTVTDIHPKCRDNMKPVDNCTEMGKPVFPCYHLPILNSDNLNEPCAGGTTYDYFSNSETSYILTFTGLTGFIIGLIGFIFVYIRTKGDTNESVDANTSDRRKYVGINGHIILAKEWVGNKNLRSIALDFRDESMQVVTTNGYLLRTIKCDKLVEYKKIVEEPYLIITPLNEYDLVLLFETHELRQNAVNEVIRFVAQCNANCTEIVRHNCKFNDAKEYIITKLERQKYLETFFKIVVSEAFNGQQHRGIKADKKITNVLKMQLTLDEFAKLLNLSKDCTFVLLMFRVVDLDNNKFISFRELVDMMSIFKNGTATDKGQFLFNMYDIERDKKLSIDTFKEMLKYNQFARQATDAQPIVLLAMLEYLEFKDFMSIIGDHIGELNDVQLRYRYSIPLQEIENVYGQQGNNINDNNIVPVAPIVSQSGVSFIRTIEKFSKDIFWKALYTLIMLAIFAERAYYYSIEREHSGLRIIAGYGVTVTRGAASAMMFTYSSLLVTMCKNINTKLRDTAVNKYFRFDSYVSFHQYIAYWALFFTVMHVIGHAFNFYHISTQPADDLTCLFRNYFHSTHELPKFHYWCWQTMTGVTGIILTILLAMIIIYALPIVRTKLYNSFWRVHSLYPLFFIFMILHGSGRLIQEPFFYYFFVGPLTLFIVDQLISFSRNKIELQIKSAEILPSGVTKLVIGKPNNFEYKSGQWVRLACTGLSSSEYHPFTLSSSPNEPTLTVHIRAVGPWTRNIRIIYEEALQKHTALPNVLLDGPFGEGHQDWDKFSISILIASGIGVTPFASILKDIVFKANNQQLRSKKVYFIWMSRDQKQFEWLMDTLREIEKKDKLDVISTQIYITAYYKKYDLRTFMLYIFESHYQKYANKSLFTNLKAQTNFGKPDFPRIFESIIDKHPKEAQIGVYSCGAPWMLSAIDTECTKINKGSNNPVLEHYYKSF